MKEAEFDVVVIGSGAGGGTMVRALAGTSARVLLLERGGSVPREDHNWSPYAVWKSLRYRVSEQWIDKEGNEFTPYTHYNVGGNTKFWGSVLYRLREQDFEAHEHMDGVSPAWPISYETLAPWYDRAEQLYNVHGTRGLDPTEPSRGPFPHPPVPHSADMQAIVDSLRGRGLNPSPLPLGLIDPGGPGGCQLCSTCNSFPCRIDAKSDAEICGVLPALEHENVRLWDQSLALRLITDASGNRVTSVDVERNGEMVRVHASLFVVSCGAVNSAALLLRSRSDSHPDGLANSSGMVGRRYMAHLATMMQGFHPFRRNGTVFQKTVAINDYYLANGKTPFPLGNIQSQGRTHGVMAKVVGDGIVPGIPLWAYDAWVARGVDWLALTEDLPHLENRVTVDSEGRIRLEYEPNNLAAHRELVREAKRILRELGYWKVVAHSFHSRNTTHQCGTACMGSDPQTSVLDSYCKAHDVDNLFVVDASFFPSSGAVNPGLTIVAQALRVADHIIGTRLT
ncbi:MAG TPA: GMC family oxidoreductase [Gemmatimonadales bacterium]|nr:GMC family oxidoreductase [Gemmatimonadales bacterium]